MARDLLIFLFLAVISVTQANKSFKLPTDNDVDIINPYTVFSVSPFTTGLVALANFTLGDLTADIIQNITITISYDNSHRVRVLITDTNDSTRWQVLNSIPPYTVTGPQNLYNVNITNGPMSILITRKSDGKTVFNLTPTQPFSYSDQDLGFVNKLGYPIKVLGLGERISSFVLNQGQYTLYSRDRTSPIDNGQTPENNIYSVHPFYLGIDNNNQAHGGVLINSNAMTAYVGPDYVGFRTTGGVLDYYVFTGPEPEDVVAQYHTLIGTPTLVPFWALGWHQCRYGFQNLQEAINVANNYTGYNIPLDVMWTDIDYMNLYEDFTVDPVN